MSKTGIRLEDVHLHYSSIAFKERSVKSLLGSLLRSNRPRMRVEDIHALKGVSASIEQGERVGLIGHNGAGKSTFLKMVAGLYPISAGNSEIRGTVRALFDISLGFEPDATGRENILYRGLLLGFTPRQMRSIEEEIVDFADLGDFIDYPIKTYSAGMQVRLAFAISTSVGGDILLLDEVIGAGDASFIAKAKRRIMKLVDEAEIMMLASHDFSTLKSICTRSLVFDHGRIVFDGPTDEATDYYLETIGLPA
ncbi:ATP-binding cassette domain-containing protein [Aliihoeflea aestuarii]|jgi:lipopolysaccharide transport system ATP-binding protein|uniref:ABC transporter ATP-binding protein n=1 Tax=Aliihoeflea aestuarii TaxID=453840 RepID=UPI00209267D8|nr:ABC transporter ATP-binding protein [Aliihoeflea aestuarii]MCO6391652.1 ATP-binding cassette domain-containing protein [Aliihoeflea aestuarii]